jgi:hypothetical protein
MPFFNKVNYEACYVKDGVKLCVKESAEYVPYVLLNFNNKLYFPQRFFQITNIIKLF